ncbi:MAG: ATP-binding protein [Acidobacteriia bacterium]|nr:ATP-binding protein [Terriglobia bacterium]
MIELSDQELLLRLRNFEDNFVERKTSADSKDWLKTIVAFANSTPIGYPSLLFIGVRDDGTLEETTPNLDSLQRTFNEKVSAAYPPVYYLARILSVEGKQILAVIVPGSEQRPHCAGQAFIRKGSETVAASDEQFANLIASRNSKAYEILKWKGKSVTVHSAPAASTISAFYMGMDGECTVVECNQFYVTLDYRGNPWSYPLSRVEISFDNEANRLQLLVLRQ